MPHTAKNSNGLMGYFFWRSITTQSRALSKSQNLGEQGQTHQNMESDQSLDSEDDAHVFKTTDYSVAQTQRSFPLDGTAFTLSRKCCNTPLDEHGGMHEVANLLLLTGARSLKMPPTATHSQKSRGCGCHLHSARSLMDHSADHLMVVTQIWWFFDVCAKYRCTWECFLCTRGAYHRRLECLKSVANHGS